MSHGLGEHAFLGIAPDAVVFVASSSFATPCSFPPAANAHCSAPPEEQTWSSTRELVHAVDVAAIK